MADTEHPRSTRSQTGSLPFSDVDPAHTASHAASYVPPLATLTSTGLSRPTSKPTSTNRNPNPTTPAFLDDYQWISSYLTIHKMSTPSYRYAYLLWLVIVLFVLIFGLLHWTGSRGGWIGATWSKWTLRRRTWRKKHSLEQSRRNGQPHRQPFSFPSNAQIASVILLIIVPLVLCFVGPDYIAPGTAVWDLTHNVTKRALADAMPKHNLFARQGPVASTSTTRAPEYTIPKAWWTVGGRTGIVAFALFPLCVLFSLKAPPFALLAFPFIIQIHFDKLARLHRWSGRIIWFITTIHVVTWGVQLGLDKRGSGGSAKRNKHPWSYVFLYAPFIYGCIGYVAMTLLIILSSTSIRTRYYEFFYIAHVILVAATIIFSALHFPPIWWWCWSAFFLWIAERLWRAGRYAYYNGFIGGKTGINGSPRSSHLDDGYKDSYKKSGFPSQESWEMNARNGYKPRLEREESGLTFNSSDTDYYNRKPEQPWDDSPTSATNFTQPQPPFKRQSLYTPPSRGAQGSTTYPPSSPVPSQPIPPGYAHAVLLPGRSIRLRIRTARPMVWAPGQHVLICVPSVSKYTSHPFTIASVCDTENDACEMVLLIRAKGGFTKQLWEEVRKLSANSYPFTVGGQDEKGQMLQRPAKRGVLLKTWVDGPFGSSVRARWGSHSSVLIVTGGSGVSFGAAVLEYICMCLAGRDGKELGGRPGGWGQSGFNTSRVRFIWLVREYSHIQWCASLIRKCLEMVPSTSTLQVDIFVSNFANKATPSVLSFDRNSQVFAGGYEDAALAPPAPRFARDNRPRSISSDSINSLDSAMSADSIVDLYYSGGGRQPPTDEPTIGELGHEEHVLDLTNFDGEDDSRTPGEVQLSQRVKKEGRLRRAKSRKVAAAAAAKVELNIRAAEKLQATSPTPNALENGTSYFPSSPRPLSGQLQPGQPHTAADYYRDPQQHLSPFDAANPGVRWGSSSPAPRASDDRDAPLSFTPKSKNRVSQHSFDPSANFERAASPNQSINFGDELSVRGLDQSRGLVALGPDEPQLDMDDDELDDLNFVAEMARPGKPKLDRILIDEVERSRGSVIVACCGPTSLNAVVRKVVAAQISPARIRSGDMRGSVSLVSEDFEW